MEKIQIILPHLILVEILGIIQTLKNLERFYSMAREVFEKSGRNIVDCTVDGACTIFERGRLEDVLR